MTPRIVAVLLAAFLALTAACGDDDDTADTPTPAGQTPSPTVLGNSPSVTNPPSSPTHTPNRTYVVAAGDTLSSIAAQFGVTVEAIAAANGIDDPTMIQVGQVLIISGAGDPVVTPTPGTDPVTPTPSSTAPPAGEVGLLTPVDKQHALPDGYAPSGIVSITGGYLAPGYGATIRSNVLPALQSMIDDAYGAGYDIRVVSGYRSYSDQVATFQYWVDALGYDEAVRVSAMPGHSEHQLGTTVDLGSSDLGWDLTEGFGNTPAGQWLDSRSHEYGFALSYPADSEAITGYAYEPWHFRYIGGAASEWKASGLTLNQYLTR